MRRALPAFLFLAGIVVMILILLAYFPKYTGILFMFFVYLLFDAYLWTTIRKTRVTNILYWTPLLILLCSLLIALFVPFPNWNITLRTWIISLLFITFFARSVPIFFLLFADLLWILRGIKHMRRRFLPHFQVRRNKHILRAGWVIGGIVWMILLCGMIFWVFDFKVRTQTITLKDLPESFRGYKVVQLSDMHLGSWTSRSKLDEAVSIVNSLDPDIILVTGDMFTFTSREGEEFKDVLVKLKARDGILCVTGNHDYGEYIRWSADHTSQGEMDRMKAFYASLGWNLLMNESKTVARGNDTILFTGVENWGFERRFQRKANLTRALKGYEHIPTQILLSHNPTFWEMVVTGNYPEIDLTLSGHTHGGQIGWETSFGRFSMLNITRTTWAGEYRYMDPSGEEQILYVNRGLGTVSYAGRVGIRPEITLIILK